MSGEPCRVEVLKPKIGKTSEPLFPDLTFIKHFKAVNLKAGDQMLAMEWRSPKYANSVEFQMLVIFTMAVFLNKEEELEKHASE